MPPGGGAPDLDGKLNDSCWQEAIPMPLSTTAGELGTDFGCKEAIERDYKEAGQTGSRGDAASACGGHASRVRNGR